jgi:signal transduction histidine kinase
MTTEQCTDDQNRATWRAIKAKLATMRDAERRRLARALHDDGIQKLIGLQLYLTHLRKSVASPTTTSGEVELVGLEEIGTEIATVVRLLRAILSDLRPPGLEAFGLRQALESFIEQCRQAWIPPAPSIQLVVSAELPVIPMSVAQVAMRVVQEALANVRRHAGATHVEVRLSGTPTHITVTIQDDGKGFQPPRHVTAFARAGHFGLLGIIEQVEGIGGIVEILSQPGRGTEVRTVMTLPPEAEGVNPRDMPLA